MQGGAPQTCRIAFCVCIGVLFPGTIWAYFRVIKWVGVLGLSSCAGGSYEFQRLQFLPQPGGPNFTAGCFGWFGCMCNFLRCFVPCRSVCSGLLRQRALNSSRFLLGTVPLGYFIQMGRRRKGGGSGNSRTKGSRSRAVKVTGIARPQVWGTLVF